MEKLNHIRKRFRAADGRANHGFTLVELVVVIAILGILAGVGTVGYSGYVRHSAKKADQTLVGNILKAIDVGVNSTMFVPEDSVSVAATSYPIGFITLTTEKGDVLGSNRTLVKAEGTCNLVEVTYTYAKASPVRQVCPTIKTGATKDVYSFDTKTTVCCTTHSSFATPEEFNNAKFATTYKHTCSLKSYGPITTCMTGALSTGWDVDGFLTAEPDAEHLVLDEAKLYGASANDPDMCELAYKTQHGTFVTKADTDVNGDGKADALVSADNALTQALEAAFGDLSALTLQYDGWGKDSEDNVDYATFYTYAPAVFEDVKDQAANLIMAQTYVTDDMLHSMGFQGSVSDFLTGGSYTDEAELVSSFAEFVSTKMTEKEWNDAWAAAGADNATVDHVFGLQEKGAKNDFIWAARMAYNSSFASYCDANGLNYTYDGGRKSYTDLISNFGHVEFGILSIPYAANTAAFNATGEGSLKEKFEQAGDADGKIFEEYAKLYKKYKDSDACKKNGAVFHSTMQTVNQTSDVARAQGNKNKFFDYYSGYLNEMADMYNEAEVLAEGGIMIIVSMNNGQIEYVVTPSNANPRNS